MYALRPSEPFVIVRLLTDHTDSSTYYVRAFVRKASDGTLFDTVTLTDQSNRIFSAVWQVPGTPQYQFIITTTVYTDAGYTTKSENYREEATHYIVEHRPGYFPQFGPGGGIDSKTMRRILQEELEKRPFPDIPEPEPVNYRLILQGFELLADKLKAYMDSNHTEVLGKMPVFKETDVQPLLKALSAVHQRVADLPAPERIDLAPLTECCDTMLRCLEELPDTLDSKLTAFTTVAEQMRDALTTMKTMLDNKVILGLQAPSIERRPALRV